MVSSRFDGEREGMYFSTINNGEETIRFAVKRQTHVVGIHEEYVTPNPEVVFSQF